MDSRPYSQGFTLLEVLVAFVILAMSLGLILEIVSRGNSVTRLSHTYADAVNIAESRLASVQTIELSNGYHTSTGQALDSYNWELTVSPHHESSEEKPYQLFKAKVTVTWRSAGKPYTLELTSLRLLPVL